MSSKGVITKEQIFQQDAINAPLEYAKNLQLAIDSTEKMLLISKNYNDLSKDFKGVKTSKEILDLKNKELKNLYGDF